MGALRAGQEQIGHNDAISTLVKTSAHRCCSGEMPSFSSTFFLMSMIVSLERSRFSIEICRTAQSVRGVRCEGGSMVKARGLTSLPVRVFTLIET